MQFSDLRLAEPILRAVASESYTVATPIQAQAIPYILAGRDVLGCAQTGTGKTAAFALPILHRLSTTPRPAGRSLVRCLILCPTRELTTQTADSFRVYGKNTNLRYATIYGGVGQGTQVQALRQGVDVLVATPGRLLDLINQRHADLHGVEVLVLDEADRMLDMGFINDIRKIVAKIPAQRQTLFFSATMPREIRTLADQILKDAVSVQVAQVAATADNVEQSVYFVKRDDKASLLAHLYESLPMARSIVFTRTKRGADRVVKRLHASGIHAEAIHGDKSQNARERALKNFKANRTPILVATDIASRGIDVDGITHVVNYDLTHEPETYVHRIGRTARAGASGMAVSFCDPEEVPNLKAIEKLLRKHIPVKSEHGFVSSEAKSAHGGRPLHPSKAPHAKPVRTDEEHSDRPAHSKSDRRPHPAGERSSRGAAPSGHSRTKTEHSSPAMPFQKSAARPDQPRIHHPVSSRPARPSHSKAAPSAHAKPAGRQGTNAGRPASRKRAY